MPHDLIKQKIQELVPEIMELKFGCEVALKINNGLSEALYKKFREIVFTTGGGVQPKYYCSSRWFKYDVLDRLKIKDGVEILGRPIQLADVLRAINNSSKTAVAITCHGFFLVPSGKNQFGDLPQSPPRIDWNLSESFDGQSDECKEFIGQLLGVTQ